MIKNMIWIITITALFLVYQNIRNENEETIDRIKITKNKILKKSEFVILKKSIKDKLSSRQNIEKIAREKLNMYVPTPESLIVWIDTRE
tara:strand:- start:117 stop:383 length:267 start_codon:yes stop_codon:yes gene_type:complete